MESKGRTLLPFLRLWILEKNTLMRPRTEFVNARDKSMSETCTIKDLRRLGMKRVVRI